jgi:hypothetical protein
MSSSRISVKRKKKRGRPATGQDPVIGLRLPEDEIAQLDEWAKAVGYTRSEAIRVLIKRGIASNRRRTPMTAKEWEKQREEREKRKTEIAQRANEYAEKIRENVRRQAEAAGKTKIIP